MRRLHHFPSATRTCDRCELSIDSGARGRLLRRYWSRWRRDTLGTNHHVRTHRPRRDHARIDAHNRGVDTKVILDAAFHGHKTNAEAFQELSGAGVGVKWAPNGVIYHQKTITVDDTTAAVGTGNQTPQYYSTSRDARVLDAGGWRSINRAGLPMIHPLFTPFNEDLGDRLNGGSPATDVDTFADTVISAVAAALAATGTASDPTAYAHSVADRLLPNVLPYTVGTSAVFGFASWNGRSLIDNAPDVMCSLATNTPVSLGIGKETVSPRPSTVFPYVPLLPPRA
jgi:PLD-like domain